MSADCRPLHTIPCSCRLARLFVAAATLSCAPASAQTPAPTPNTQQIRLAIPADARPVPAQDERLLVESPGQPPQVVQLYCRIEPYALVMLPTGELTLMKSSN